ncbi:MAG TPA: ABC transporter substrate-binding protein [Miltoncostaea sp.]|nr:ABC transporter substrate-binding protein [Miltoncostaea sp.]
MRVVSLLPSATEILFAIGAGDRVVGVTFECDHPPEARSRRIVSTSALAEGLTLAEIDAAVSARMAAGEDLYHLDEGALADLDADLVVTQDLCAVCAVDAGDVRAALDHLGCDGRVLTVAPGSLGEVLASIVTLGTAVDAGPAAARLVAGLEARLRAVGERVAGARRPRTLVLEWTDPPFAPGHWVPEMVAAAGGEPVLGTAARPSERVTWEAVAAAGPEVVVCAPCGFGLADAAAAGRALLAADVLPAGAEVWAVDANASWARPGPRLVDGVEALAGILHPERARPPAPEAAQILRRTPTTTPASVTSSSGTIGS